MAVEHQLVGLWRDGSLLRAYTYTHFTDKSGRADYGTHDIFQPAN